MLKRTALSAAAVAICATTAAAWAADGQPSAPAAAKQAAPTEMIYGSQLMTNQERIEYRNRMRAATTQAERDAIRAEHHAKMQERAKEKGLTLPEMPPPGGGMGGGMGRGMGSGMGGGMGGGMGPGPNR